MAVLVLEPSNASSHVAAVVIVNVLEHRCLLKFSDACMWSIEKVKDFEFS